MFEESKIKKKIDDSVGAAVSAGKGSVPHSTLECALSDATYSAIDDAQRDETNNVSHNAVVSALQSALPIMLGYVAIGIPCGILSSAAGLNVVQVLMLSVLFYSGAGQFMISNMFIAGSPIASIALSVSLVNTRQMLYAATLSPFCSKIKKFLSVLFAATVTDESFGVNITKFSSSEPWSVKKATLVNIFSQGSWIVSNVVGFTVSSVISIPLAIASFAMTSIFICLLFTQKFSLENVVAAIAAIVGVVFVKCIGLSGIAVLIGAVFGVFAAMVVGAWKKI